MTQAPSVVAPSVTARRKKRRLAVVGLVLVAALVFLLVEGLGSSLDYYDSVHQALSDRHSLGTSTFRLQGVVVRGSVHPTAAGTNFVVSANGRDRGELVTVDNSGTPPQSFAPGIPVIVVGHFARSDEAHTEGSVSTAGAGSTVDVPLFVSNSIMVKHSADYVAAQPKGTGTNR